MARFRTGFLLIGLVMGGFSSGAAASETVRLFAAGSLKYAMADVARAFEKASDGQVKVETMFRPSGLLRARIEKEGGADLFASANMKHPEKLAKAGMVNGGVKLFAKNQLCAIAQQEVSVTSETLLDTLFDDKIRIGMSTPNADPSGDYAVALFKKAEPIKAGAEKRLNEKALQLTGGPNSEKAPTGRNQYGWVMSEKRADVFLTYCTNAVLAKKDTASLKIVAIPENLAVGARYGLVVMKTAPDITEQLAEFILGQQGQAILKSYGFGPGE